MFTKFKTYFVRQKVPISSTSENSSQIHEIKSNSFDLILEDLLGDSIGEQKDSEMFQELVFQKQQDEGESVENIYLKDFIFINKQTQGRLLKNQQWLEMINKHNLSIYSKKDMYFSIYKGIDFVIRRDVWNLLANTSQMKKSTHKTYIELTNINLIDKKELNIIQKDIPRTSSITIYLKQLKNILIAYVNFSGKSYTQGMNLIAGSLLSLLSFKNDEKLQSFEIQEQQFEQRIFWIFIGIMKEKNWQNVFEHDLSGLKQMLNKLQKLMKQFVPSILTLIEKMQWDLTIFSQYYITILLYNTPRQFSKIILDLFLLDGQNIIHSLIIRMMQLQEEKILNFSDQVKLMNYFKKDLLIDSYQKIKQNKINAKKLEDFDINFIKSYSL